MSEKQKTIIFSINGGRAESNNTAFARLVFDQRVSDLLDSAILSRIERDVRVFTYSGFADPKFMVSDKVNGKDVFHEHKPYLCDLVVNYEKFWIAIKLDEASDTLTSDPIYFIDLDSMPYDHEAEKMPLLFYFSEGECSRNKVPCLVNLRSGEVEVDGVHSSEFSERMAGREVFIMDDDGDEHAVFNVDGCFFVCPRSLDKLQDNKVENTSTASPC